MGRKNRRRETYVPLDLTPPKPTPHRGPPPPPDGLTPSERYERSRERERDRAERQRQARISRGVDWSVCLVPGCGEDLVFYRMELHPDPQRRDVNMELPICYKHCGVLWRQLARLHMDDARFIEAIVDVNARVADREERLREKRHDDLMKRQDGDIYFIRVGHLVKVGWTRDLWARVKSYGASAELLVHYPGTRDDETNLHRQLRPALARGREWYEDGATVDMFIREAIERYGPPSFTSSGWTEPKQVVAGKRAMRYRN